MQPSALAGVAVLSVFLMLLPEARGILCYQCNSKRDPGCEELAPPPANGTARYLLPCDDGRDGEPSFCRKSIIKVKRGPQGEEESRWVRACGWIKHKSECYQFDDDDHHELVCQCFVDGCNAASARAYSLLGAVLLPLAALALQGPR